MGNRLCSWANGKTHRRGGGKIGVEIEALKHIKNLDFWICVVGVDWGGSPIQWENSWKSLKIHEIIENHWKSSKTNENHWKSLKKHWKVIENHGKPWKIIENHWKTLKTQWKSLKINGKSLKNIEKHLRNIQKTMKSNGLG